MSSNEYLPTDVLLVEDNISDEELALIALKRGNVEHVQVTRDGEEALDYIFCRGEYKSRDSNMLPKLILLDLKLPKIDGIEVLEQLKSNPRTRSIPVVMLTTSTENADITKSYKKGVNSYIVKPLHFEQFADAINKVSQYWLGLNQSPFVV